MNELIINKKDLINNINEIKSKESKEDYTIIAVIKGNGYGMDMIQLANTLTENGIDFFAVAAVDEAIKLRQEGIKEKILLLTPISDKEIAKELIKNDIILTIDSEESAKIASDISKEIKKEVISHIKIDTGLNRYGFDYREKEIIEKTIKKYSNINYEGIFSHFSNSLSSDDSWSKTQYSRFMKIISYLEENGLKFKLKHICNSSGFFKYPDMHLNAARIGSAFYGMAVGTNSNLIRIGKLHTKVTKIRHIKKGEFIGYANSYIAKKDMKIAILPTGYFDGIGRDIETQRFKFKSKLKKLLLSIKNIFKDDTIYLKVNGEVIEVIGQIGMHDVVLDITGKMFEENEDVYIDVRPGLIESSVKRIYQ